MQVELEPIRIKVELEPRRIFVELNLEEYKNWNLEEYMQNGKYVRNSCRDNDYAIYIDLPPGTKGDI